MATRIWDRTWTMKRERSPTQTTSPSANSKRYDTCRVVSWVCRVCRAASQVLNAVALHFACAGDAHQEQEKV